MPRSYFPTNMYRYGAMQGAGGSGALSFSPLDLSPTAWYRADLGVTGTTSVTVWADQSGNGHDLVTGTAPNLIASSINGKPAINFTAASSEYLEVVGGSIIAAETEIWVVFKKTSTPIGGTFIDAQSTNHTASVQSEGTADTFQLVVTPAALASTDTIADGVAGYITGLFSTSGTDSISVNNGTPVTGNIGPPTGAGLTVGSRGGVNSNFIDGAIAEILIVPAALAGGGLSNYTNYLSRYGL